MPKKSIIPIIVGEAHYNTLGLIRSFGEEGIDPILVLVCNSDNDKHSFVTKSKYIKKSYFTSLQNLIIDLKNINLGHSYGIIFPSGDEIANIIDSNYHSLANKYINPFFDRIGCSFSIANDKENMRKIAEKHEFKTPKTWNISSVDALTEITIEFPVVIKSIHSQDAPKDTHIYNDLRALTCGIKELMKHTKEIQIQSFIRKDKEIIFLGYSFNNEVYIPCIMEKKREYPESFGCTGLGVFSPKISRYFDINKLKEFIRSYHYQGLFSVEFIVKHEEPYFLEINFRNDGNGYFPGFGGVNLPVKLFHRYEGRSEKRELLISSEFTMIREYNDFKWCLHNHYSLYNWIKDIRKADVFQYWNKNDKKPFFSFITTHLIDSIKNRVSHLAKNH